MRVMSQKNDTLSFHGDLSKYQNFKIELRNRTKDD